MHTYIHTQLMDGQIHDIEAEVGLAGGRRRIREWRGGIEEGDRGI